MSGNDSEDVDDMSDGSGDIADNADTEDADVFEMLGESDHPAMAIPEQATSDELPVFVPPPERSMDKDIQSEVANLNSSPLVVTDPFPHGSPGAPISQGSCTDDTDRMASDSSIWAPFHSQCDWAVAHWAKMRGPTSSTMADLLVIPEVLLYFTLVFV